MNNSKGDIDEKHLKDDSTKGETVSHHSSPKSSHQSLTMKLYHRFQDKCQEIIEDGWERIDQVHRYIAISNVVVSDLIKAMCYERTIYNQFIEIWLANQLPHNPEQIMSFGEFLKVYQNFSRDATEKSVELARKFYAQACEMWINMKDPQLKDIKLGCLLIVAFTINNTYEIEDEGFASTLNELFALIDSKKCDIVSDEEFYQQASLKLKPKIWREAQYRRAITAFYTFAKRFAFLEFPLGYANQSILKVLITFSQAKLDVLGELFLARIDNMLNLLMKRFGIEYHEKERPEGFMTLMERYHRVLEKILFVATESYSNTKHAIEGSETYQYLDQHIHFEDRYKDLVLLSQYIYGTAAYALTPAFHAVKFTYNKVLKAYVVAIGEVSADVIKRSYGTLKDKYAILKDATLHLKDNILEIRINKETFEKYSNEVKEQIALVVEEIKSLNYEKAKFYGSKAYQKALETFRGRAKSIEGF